MSRFLLPVFLFLVFLLLLGAIRGLQSLADFYKNRHADTPKIETFRGLAYAGMVLAVIYLIGIIYFYGKGSSWEGHVVEWLNISIRLLHITFGIAWIGASFYFVFLENSLNRTQNVRDELAGNLWAVHGGGFYYLEKYKLAPKEIPRELHWFKYEAYFTWLSGISLLFVVYYFNAKAMLIDPQVLALSPLAGMGLGLASLVAGWIIYHLLCRTALVQKGIWFVLLGIVICTAFAWFYTQVFSGRAAFIHFGALLGTLMVGNVFFIIIPAQKAMVKAAREGLPLDPALGQHAGLRSLHNNYFTLPVLFVMISNHFPGTFGHEQPWLILALISLGTAGVKHWLNLREKNLATGWVLPASVVLLLAVTFLTAPKSQPPAASCRQEVRLAQVQQIMQARCVSCHALNPTDDVFKVAPNGVKFDNPETIVNFKDKILQRTVISKTMPLNNKTGMTEEERELIRCWVAQGGRL